MADLPVFTVCPPLRCHFRMPSKDPPFCGARAWWMAPNGAPLFVHYFCDAHRGAWDKPIPADIVFRRVQLVAEMLFAGISAAAAESHAEALGRLERLVDQAGGVLNLHTASSTIGRYGPQALATPHIVGPFHGV